MCVCEKYNLNVMFVCFQSLHRTPELEKVLMDPIDSNGNTIAHIAAEGNHVSVFKVLTL